MAEVNEVNVSQGGRMAEGEGGRGSKLKIILIAIILLIVLGGGGMAALMFLGGGPGEAGVQMPGTPGRVTGVAETCPTDQLMYLNLGEFVVNLADGRRYLKTNIDLMLCDDDVDALHTYLNTRQAEIKDRVVARLQTLSTEQLRTPREREQLRQDLLNEIYRLLPNEKQGWEGPEPIKKVLITEFYLQ